jgi:hypothetical protein
MNETLKRLGLELRRRYRDALRRPMNWRMIDAFVRLEELDEQKSRDRTGGAAVDANVKPEAAGAPKSNAAGNVIDLQTRPRERD